MKVVFQTIGIILLALLLCFAGSSCNTESSRDVKFKAKELRRSSITLNLYTMDYTDIISADSAYSVGDTIIYDQSTRYVLISKVQ